MLVIGVMSAGFAGPAYAADDASSQSQVVATADDGSGGSASDGDASDGSGDSADGADSTATDDGESDGDGAAKSHGAAKKSSRAAQPDSTKESDDSDSSSGTDSSDSGDDDAADADSTDGDDSSDSADDSENATDGDEADDSGSDGDSSSHHKSVAKSNSKQPKKGDADSGSDTPESDTPGSEDDSNADDAGSDEAGSDAGSGADGDQGTSHETAPQLRSFSTESTDSPANLEVIAEVDGDPVADASQWKYTAQGQYHSIGWSDFTSSNSPFTLSSGDTHKMDQSYKPWPFSTRSGDDIRYQVSEDSIPDGYEQDSSTCTGGNSPDGVTPSAGNTVTCTFSYSKLDPATVTVKVGGDRDGNSPTVNGLADVELGLFTNKGDADPVNSTWAVCTSDASGDCTFEVPASELSFNAHYPYGPQTSFWVKQISTASGYFMNDELAYGTTPVSNTPYRFETPKLESGETYTSGTSGYSYSFMADRSADNRTSGTWQNSRNNPGTSQMCGIDLALILDTSGSIAKSGSTDDQINAANGVVDALTGTHSKVGVYSFANGTNDSKSATSVSTNSGAQSVKDFINSDHDINHPNGATNWDEGIAQVLGSSTPYDVAVIVTDGNPTTERNGNHGNGSRTDFAEVEGGIFSANAVKALGTQMVAIGVGAGVSGDSVTNLKAISGPDDYYSFDDFADAAATIKDLALGACSGSVTITKNVMDRGSDDISQSSAAGGWDFSATSNDNGVTLSKTSGTTDNDGTVNFPVDVDGGVDSGTVTFTETQQDGYRIFPVDGKNAVCTNNSTSESLTVTNASSGPGFSVDVGSAAAVTCQVYNQENPTVTLNKQWKHAANGDTATLTVGDSSGDSTASSSDATSSGITHLDKNVASESFSPGSNVTVSESLSGDNHGSYSSKLLCTDDTTGDELTKGSGDFTMPKNDVTCTFTNENQKQGVTLQKKWMDAVAGDTADLTINDGDGVTSTATGTDGIDSDKVVTGTGFVGVPVTVGETLGDNLGDYGAEVSCTAGGDSDWTNDGQYDFAMPDSDVTCTITNSAKSQTLTVVKKWVNASDGDTVTIDVNGTELFSPEASDDSQADTNVVVGTGVTITESQTGSNDANYTVSDATCTGADATWESGELTFTMPNDDVTCTITNTADTSTVTFIKEWVNGVEGDSTDLTIGGSVEGEGGTSTSTVGEDRSFTDNDHAATADATQGSTVSLSEEFGSDNVGTYSLSMTCDNDDIVLSQGYEFTMPNRDITCYVVNTLESGTLTLVKKIDDEFGGEATPSDWDLTGTLDGSGFSVNGTANDTDGTAVDEAVVPAGTYSFSESDGPDGYKLSDLTCYVNNDELTLDGDTLNVTEGQDYRCVLTNKAQPAHLTLVKELDESHGGHADATAWTLSATPTGSDGSAISGASGDDAVTDASLAAGTYALGESGGPAGYTRTSLVCDGTDSLGDDGILTLANGDDVTCTFTNSDQPAHLTLIKDVVNTNGGDASATDWTLSATLGDTTVEGVSGSDEVTDIAVSGGTYTLGESDGPSGYDWTGLTCSTNTDDLTLDPQGEEPPVVQVAPGDNVECTFTNSDQPAHLTLVKDVSPEYASSDNWTLTADGDADSVSGVSGSDEVTGAPVNAGESFALSESANDDFAGADEFTPGSWTCYPSDKIDAKGAAIGLENSEDGTATLPALSPGEDVTCTITNTWTNPGVEHSKTVTEGPTWDADAGDWMIQYTITYTNNSQVVGVDYSLTDTPAFADGVSVNSTEATLNGSDIDWHGGDLGAHTVDPATTDTYVVTVHADTTGMILADGGDAGADYTTQPVCDGPNTGFYNSAEFGSVAEATPRLMSDEGTDEFPVVPGEPGTDTACADVPTTTFEHTKTVDSTSQNDDGTWNIAYTIEVDNTGDNPGAYSLDDTLRYGDGFTIGQASWSLNGDAETDTWSDPNAADATATLATNRHLDAAGTDTYTVTVENVDVPAGALAAGETTVCPSDDADSDGAFNNTSGLTVYGDTATASACDEPNGSSPAKAFVSAVQNPDDPESWSVTYTVTVTNNGDHANHYSVVDEPGFADEVTIDGVTVDGTAHDAPFEAIILEGVVQPDEPVTHTVVFEVTVEGTVDQQQCTGEPGSGFFNAATLTVGNDEQTVTACGDVTDQVGPTVTKTAEGTAQNADGSWTTTYDVTVTQPAADSEANPEGLSGRYSLSDALAFGEGITITDAAYTDAQTGDAHDWGATDQAQELASDRVIQAGDTHTYVVTATATITQDAVDADTVMCRPDSEANSGFLNTAVLSTATSSDQHVEACAQPNIPIASLSLATTAMCEVGVPSLNYEVRPISVLDPGKVALIWWSQSGYEDRDASIDPSDEEALLADGAVAVDYLGMPSGWQSGDAISGTMLWPGSAIGDNGKGAGWPGYTQDADGNWVLNADSATYPVRSAAVLEVRTVNASNALDVVRQEVNCLPPLPLVVTGGPEPTPKPTPEPTTPTPESPTPQPVPLVITGGELPFTGSNALWLLSFGGLLLVFGAGLTTLVAIRRRRRDDPTGS